MRKISYILFILLLLISCNLRKSDKLLSESGINSSIESNSNTKIKNEKVEITGLLYHRFGDHKYPSTNISTSLFEKHLKYLKENNFQVITLGEAMNLLFSNDIAGRYVVITIDDGFNSFKENGLPLLKKYGFTATLFVNTETVGSGDYLNWEDLAMISSYGIEIGNHTHSHDYFLDMDQSERYIRFKNEIVLAQQLLDEKLDVQPVVFAYPFGEYDSQMKQEIADLGFIGAAAQNSGVISHYSDFYALPRFPMTDQYGSMKSFIEKLFLKPLPVIFEDPQTTIPVENPPILRIQLKEGNYNIDQAQCFIQGGSCTNLTINSTDRIIEFRSDAKLKNRRHLYTITIPDKSGKEWYWYSHQWVFPEIKE